MKSVVICSSNRFAKEAIVFAEKLRKLGVNVVVPHYYAYTYGWSEDLKDYEKRFIATGLTHEHFSKIRKADVVFVYNKDGYSGNSVTLEIGYSGALNKTMYAFSKDDSEVCRDILFDGYADTPAKLLKFLK